MSVIEEVCTITVSIQSVAESEKDPVLAAFLVLLERDFVARPEALVSLTPEMAARMMAATEGVEVDRAAPIKGGVTL